MIIVEEFDKVEMRVGTIINVSINKRARISAYKLTIDLDSSFELKLHLLNLLLYTKKKT